MTEMTLAKLEMNGSQFEWLQLDNGPATSTSKSCESDEKLLKYFTIKCIFFFIYNFTIMFCGINKITIL